MLALWVVFVLSLLLFLVPSLYTSCIPLGVLFNTISYQSKKKKYNGYGSNRYGIISSFHFQVQNILEKLEQKFSK